MISGSSVADDSSSPAASRTVAIRVPSSRSTKSFAGSLRSGSRDARRKTWNEPGFCRNSPGRSVGALPTAAT